MTTITNRFPTLEEARPKLPLHETYWWFEGWNFNRPIIACCHTGAHIREGVYVAVSFYDEFHSPQHREADMLRLGIPMKFTGPIEFPTP